MQMRVIGSFQAIIVSLSIFVILLAAELVWCSPSTSPIGTIKEIRSGTLERQNHDVWTPLAAGMAIFANDRVRTGADSTAILSINEIGIILIGPRTEYYLGHTTSDFKTLLKHGYLWFSATLTPGRSMSVATDSAIASVRGTKFSVIQDSRGMEVSTCKGSVEVGLRDGKMVHMTSGMYEVVDASGKMELPGKGKRHLEEIWNEKPERYKPCLSCHKRGKKIGDLN